MWNVAKVKEVKNARDLLGIHTQNKTGNAPENYKLETTK